MRVFRRAAHLIRHLTRRLNVGDVFEEFRIRKVKDGVCVILLRRVDAYAREDVRHRVNRALLMFQRLL